MKKKGVLSVFVLLFLLACVSGCGRSSDSSKSMASDMAANGAMYNDSDGIYSYASAEDDYSMDEEVEYEEKSETTSAGEEPKQEEAAGSGRKLIRRVSLSAETTKFDELIVKLTNRVDELGGYIENSDIYGGGIYDSSTRSADFTIRIPSSKLDSFVDEVAEASNVTHKSQNVEDITLQYVDLQSKKEALVVEQERLMELLEKADSLESVLALESRLTEVRYELQSMESRLRTYDNQVDYATVDLRISEVEIYTPPEPKGIWEEVSTGFVDSLKGVGNGLVNFFVGLIIALPYLAVWGIGIWVAVWIIKKLIRRRKARKAKKAELKKQQKENAAGSLRMDGDLPATEKSEDANDAGMPQP